MIFGTDGLRAAVGREPLTESTIVKLSHVLAKDLGSHSQVVIGRDTRRSGQPIFQWITRQLASVDIIDLGIVPTPTVAFETKQRKADLGIMITASHNPPGDNGLKFFDSQGLKVQYETAKRWSAEVEALSTAPKPDPAASSLQAPTHYHQFITKVFKPQDFEGLRVAFDFAHGGATGIGQELITHLIPGAIFLGNLPTGDNINQDVGALNPGALQEVVTGKNLDAGFAFDGDGDRLVMVDQQGVLHGDLLLYALKCIMEQDGHQVDGIVGTILCGLGFENLLKSQGVTLHRVPVGDQHVLAKMVSDQLLLGGEPSGHLIQADLFPAGDGLLAALRIAKGLAKNKKLLAQARQTIPIFPILEEAYLVRHKPALETLDLVQQAKTALVQALGEEGRVILRYSGTEQKIRLFVEAPDLAPCQPQIDGLKKAIEETLS